MIFSDKKNAYGAFNIFNYETIKGVFMGASKSNREVYLQTSAPIVQYYSPKIMFDIIRAASNGFDRKLVKVHLDHCNDLELIAECINCGWDSVMIDTSDLSLTENIYLTKKVVELAHSKNIIVEGELGQIGGEEDNNTSYEIKKVNIEDVQKYINSTNVDLLAIGIGNKHGYYTSRDSAIDLNLLKNIHELLPEQLLVLHGATGIPHNDILRAIKLGIHKINISTELKDCYLNILKQHINNKNSHNMTRMIDLSVEAISELVSAKINLFAGDIK